MLPNEPLQQSSGSQFNSVKEVSQKLTFTEGSMELKKARNKSEKEERKKTIGHLQKYATHDGYM